MYILLEGCKMLEEIRKSKEKYVRLNIMLDQETDIRLHRIAIKYNTTKSEIVRFALKKTIPELEERAKRMEA